MRGFLRAVKADLFSRRSRYEFIEWAVRNVPGRMGRYLRYRLLTPWFRKCGHNVIIREGIRIQEPWLLDMGSDVAIGLMCTLQCGGGLVIEDTVLLGAGVKIWTTNHVFENPDRPIREQGLIADSVRIGPDCWIASDVFVKPGTCLPRGTIVQPMSVVGRLRAPECSVLAGNPAKVLGPRSRVGAFMAWGLTNTRSRSI